jgi:hypothetical protein
LDEAYDRKVGRVVSIAEAVSACLSDVADHEFDCADDRCHAPVVVSSYMPTNKREPYVASCKMFACHKASCACVGKDAGNPVLCHVPDCEYLEDSSPGFHRGGRLARAAHLVLVAPTAIHVASRQGVGSRPISHRVRVKSGNFTLFKLVSFLGHWAAASPHSVAATMLKFEKRALLLPQWFCRPEDLAVNAAAANERETQRYIYFGFASFSCTDPSGVEARVRALFPCSLRSASL